MWRHLVLLLALIAACLAPPSAPLVPGGNEISASQLDGVPAATHVDDGTDLGSYEDPDAGAPPKLWHRRLVRRHSFGATVPTPVADAIVARSCWDKRRDIRRCKPTMCLGRGEPAELLSS